MATQGQISQLAGQMPVASQQIATGQRAARDLQLQQMAGAATPQQATPQVAQQAGTQLAQMAGQQQVERVQQLSGAQEQLQQLGQNLKSISEQRKIADVQTGLQMQQISNEERLAQLDLSAKQEMFDNRLRFETDELGRKFSNERQLADWVRMNAKSQEELRDYEQKMGQLSDRSRYMSEVAVRKVSQEMELNNAVINQLRDQATNLELSKAEREAGRELLNKKLAQKQRLDTAMAELQKSIARKRAEAAARSARNGAIMGTVGAVAGGIVGGIFGGGAPGAVAGAAVGQKLGEGVGSFIG